MKTKLLRSVVTLAAVAAVGVGATFAAFTSNTVTISGNEVTTGSAELKLCNSGGADNWRNTISPLLAAEGLNPGGPAVDLTSAGPVYIGNDSGDLDDNGLDELCDEYFDSEGSSTVEMTLTPELLVEATCEGDLTPADLDLTVTVGGESLTKTLAVWFGNDEAISDFSFLPDEIEEVTLSAELAEGVEDQGETCSFDLTFTGNQVVDEG